MYAVWQAIIVILTAYVLLQVGSNILVKSVLCSTEKQMY